VSVPPQIPAWLASRPAWAGSGDPRVVHLEEDQHAAQAPRWRAAGFADARPFPGHPNGTRCPVCSNPALWQQPGEGVTNLIINAGSDVGEPGDGWANTREEAVAEAGTWLTRMHDSGMTDVELLDGAEERGGRWVFTFRHKVTEVTAELETPGIDNLEAYQRQHIFPPRVYWNGSSCSVPELEDFAAPGFVPVRTFKATSDGIAE
jgi:hypothetical protein